MLKVTQVDVIGEAGVEKSCITAMARSVGDFIRNDSGGDKQPCICTLALHSQLSHHMMLTEWINSRVWIEEGDWLETDFIILVYDPQKRSTFDALMPVLDLVTENFEANFVCKELDPAVQNKLFTTDDVIFKFGADVASLPVAIVANCRSFSNTGEYAVTSEEGEKLFHKYNLSAFIQLDLCHYARSVTDDESALTWIFRQMVENFL